MVRNEGLPDIRCGNRIINGYELSIEEMRLLETDGAARGETEQALASPLAAPSVDFVFLLRDSAIFRSRHQSITVS